MSGEQYTIVAYAVSLGLLWGYGLLLAISRRTLRQRERGSGGRS